MAGSLEKFTMFIHFRSNAAFDSVINRENIRK